MLDFGKVASTTARKVFRAADYTAGKGAPADFAGFIRSLKSGDAYFNVHTEGCKSGEIRGQIE